MHRGGCSSSGLTRKAPIINPNSPRVRPTSSIVPLGLWIADNEGAKFWLSVMNELRNRGVQDILIAVLDGLKGFPGAITAAFPEATVQTCIKNKCI